MARTYFVSFMIATDSGYSGRYSALHDALLASADGKYWDQTTSFILFESDQSVEHIVATIKGAINVRTDIAVLGMTDFKTMRVIGANPDDDIYDLVPFAKKA